MLRHSLLCFCVLIFGIGFVSCAHARDEIIAVVNGESFSQKDFLNKNVERQFRKSLAINTFRPVAEANLISLRLSSCQIEPDNETVSEFVRWWQNELTAIRLAVIQIQSENELPGGEASNAVVKQINDTILKIRNEDIAVIDVARNEIHQWLRYSCVQEHYKGDKFFVPDGSFDRVVAQMAANDPTMTISKNGMAFPYVPRLPEPISSLGRFFAEAEQDKQLEIPDSETREYFFSRYTGDKYANRTANEVLTRLDEPYWRD